MKENTIVSLADSNYFELLNELIDSIKKGLIAFIIALYGELGMFLSPFWTVFLVSYFLTGWV